jgi:hypothetical protein
MDDDDLPVVTVTMRYQPNDDELFATSVELPHDWPDALWQARDTCNAGIKALIGDAIEVYKREAPDSVDVLPEPGDMDDN